jgi:hypothetical protein
VVGGGPVTRDNNIIIIAIIMWLSNIVLVYCRYDIFINCNWVVTRWPYTFTRTQYMEKHKQPNNANNN